MHESRQYQMMKIEKMKNQNNNYIQIDHEWQNTHTKIEIASTTWNTRHADHQM
jgi:vancomycin resistance protein YoaR